MNVQLVSDLHFEFHRDEGRNFVKNMDASEVDVLVVAGDLAAYRNLEAGLSFLIRKYPEVVFVPGNHEYYGTSPEKLQQMKERLSARFLNLHWLEEEVWVHQEQRFLGTTLWFANSREVQRRKHFIYDFTAIQDFEPWVYTKNQKGIDFLNRELKNGDVVVTHHLPHPLSIAPRFLNSSLNVFFFCDVENLVAERGARVWVHGHTHDPVDETIGRTRLLCNPLGYPHEGGKNFRDRLIIEGGA